MYLLDTNVISELRKAGSGKANQNVVAWAARIPSSQLYVSVITLLELEMGVLSIERKDKQQGEVLRHWLENNVIPAFSERTLVLDTPVARRCAAMHVPDRRSERDAMIAATAATHNMTVVTRNINDFMDTGVELLNPWESF
ncbi:type II toxin-antitoxin system VapC family toxin [Leucothrix pacifica]|uniref:VapC toxin family PIN domain ribonuclease n=1 Tax=Leucothrix pacifica TaxID=1247513 RepID=A0A317C0M5_9GAMM|nr:type II toxin-antitoxin system VapC family toxin [Leucothrix pacifica]PWQ92108.1 VapC toxin family PIN domain ribonuclease [Leucothrix pacifica]